LDLQDIGIDVEDDTLLAARSWHWLRKRILGLMQKPSRLRSVMIPDK
jgi:hypothetical protein